MLWETLSTVRVISASQIRDRGYFRLDDALADLPGIQRRDTIGLNSYAFFRGIPNQNNLTLLLIDGVQVNELNSGGFYGGGQYNLSNTKRIEVVYGPDSALYGTNAVSGVINIVTKDPWDDPGLRIQGLYGSFGTVSADMGYSYWEPEKRRGFRLAAMYKTSNRADLTGSRGGDYWTADLETFETDLSMDGKFVWKNLTVGINYLNRAASSATYHTALGTEYLDHDTYWNIHFFNAHAGYEWKLSPSFELIVKAMYRNATVADNSVREVTTAGQFGFYRPNHLLGQETMLVWSPLTDLSLTAGVVTDWERLADGYATSQSDSPELAPPHPDAPEFSDNFLVSSYLQARYELWGMLQLDAGARYDYSTLYDHVVTPRGGLMFHRGNFRARFSYGEGFRAPKPWDYTDGEGNSGLVPDRIRSAELGASYTFMEKVRFGVTGYRNVLFDVLAREDLSDNKWRWANRGRVDVWGLEAEIDVYIWKTRTFANYTYTHSRDEEGNPVPEIADHMANLGIALDFTKQIRLDVRCSYQGVRKTQYPIDSSGGTLLDDAFLLNSTLSFIDFGGFDLQFIVQNALDAEYYHPSNQIPARYRQPQRTFMVNGGYRF